VFAEQCDCPAPEYRQSCDRVHELFAEMEQAKAAIQAIMRHTNVAVTQQAYIKTLPRQSVDAMKRLEMLIGDTSSAILQ
jgi:integrase